MGARYENAALSQGSHADEGMATLEGCNPQRDPITYCKQLISDDRFLIVGSQVGGDLSKIAADFNLPEIGKVTHHLELCTMARKRGMIQQARAGLEVMHNTIVGGDVGKMDKRKTLRLSDWSARPLSDDQVAYATGPGTGQGGRPPC